MGQRRFGTCWRRRVSLVGFHLGIDMRRREMMRMLPVRAPRPGRMGAIQARLLGFSLAILAGGTWALAQPAPLAAQTAEPPPLAARPFVDFWGAVKDFGRDTWLVASGPSRLDRPSALKLGGVLALSGLMFAFDEELADALDADADPEGNRGFLRDVGEFVEPVGLQGDTNIYFAGAAVLGYLTRQDWLKDPAKQILYSQWIGGMGRQLAGRIVGRRRPHQGEGAYAFEPGEGTSFPSGHSAVAFELAYVLSHHIDRWPATVTLYGLAASMAFQRTDSNSHWASDAFLGSAWGYFVARTVVGAEESDRISVEPVVDGGSGRVGFGLTIPF